MEKEYNNIKMEILDTKVILLMARLKEKENLYMKMTHIIQANLKIIFLMEKE